MDHHQSYSSQLRRAGLALFWVLAAGSALADERSIFVPGSDVELGGDISLAAPSLVETGILLRLNAKVEYFLSGGYTPLPDFKGDLFSVAIVEFGTRYRPWGGPFFLGASFGYQNLGYQTYLSLGSLTPNLSSQLATINLESFSFYPSVGFMWTGAHGFRIGFDVGAQIPIFSGGGLFFAQNANATTQAQLQSLQAGAGPTLSYFGSIVLPRITLLRIGWML